MPKVTNFLEAYLKVTEYAESPTSYLHWGGLVCLAATLRDNVYFEHPARLTRVYPNIYVLLFGESSNVRKATPLDTVEKLLRGTKGVNNTKVVGGRASMQGVMKTLATSENGSPPGGSGIMIARELAAFYAKDNMTIPYLTDLYDFKEFYDGHLASYDIPPIKNLCLSLFAGTNDVMAQTLIDTSAKEGGLMGRSFIISEERRRLIDSGFEDHEYPTDDSWIPLQIFLKQLSTVKGPVHFSEPARKWYNDWYHTLDFEKLRTRTGYEGRMQTHVQKVAVILAAARSNFDRIVELEDVQYAIKLVTERLIIYKKMMYGSGQAPNASFQVLVSNELYKSKNNWMSRMQLLFNLHGNVTGTQLDEIMKDFIDSGLIIESSNKGTMGYKMTQLFLDQIAGMKAEEERKSKGHHGD